MRCRFEVGEAVRRAPRNCGRAPDRKWNKSGPVGTIWVISDVCEVPWLTEKPGTCPDCWPVRVATIDFPLGGWICSCIFDPIGKGEPVKTETRQSEPVQ